MALALALDIGIGIGIGSKEQQKNLKQRGKVEGDSNCTNASHHGVAEQGEAIVRLLDGKKGALHTNHLETKILEAAQATRYPPEAAQGEN